ncbi:MAG: small multi-drug export protein [Planctomycetales bacterium]|nr:small multi-drug export protein [Planctomycetales bacterium]
MDSVGNSIPGEKQNNHPGALKGLVLTSAEGHVLIIGTVLVFFYAVYLGFQLVLSIERFHALIAMTAAEVVFGRITCMALGYSTGFSHVEVVLISMFLETVLVMVSYPVFVFIWRQLLVIKWLKKSSDKIRRAAERHKETIRRYGAIGIFIFVWLPFWMTGPVVGCMIGYLLGLRVWVNITTALAGTYVAILGWAYLLRQLHEKTISYSSYAIVAVAVLIAAVMMGLSLRQRFGCRRKK